jgi:hypothetical protein
MDTPKQTIIERNDAEDAAAAAQLDLESLGEYSGRGMYDQVCFGIRVDQVGEAAAFLVALAVEVSESFAYELCNDWHQDNLEIGQIVYFPHFRLEDES